MFSHLYQKSSKFIALRLAITPKGSKSSKNCFHSELLCKNYYKNKLLNKDLNLSTLMIIGMVKCNIAIIKLSNSAHCTAHVDCKYTGGGAIEPPPGSVNFIVSNGNPPEMEN